MVVVVEDRAMNTKKPALLLPIALLFGTAAAFAQQTPGRDLSTTSSTSFGVKNMTFDLWCQDTQRYPTARCEARRPADVKAFESYRSAIERYEVDHLKQVQRDRDQRAITNRDPLSTVFGKQVGTP